VRLPKLSTLALTSLAFVFVAVILIMVAASLTRPEVETFVPTTPSPKKVGDRSVGPRDYTVDATAHDRWVYFDLSRGSVVQVGSRRSLDWDIAFQRHRMITNGGATNPLGMAGAIDLGPVALGTPLRAPASGYAIDEKSGDEYRNPALEHWYDYSWLTHVLRPAHRSFALRTADGKYALVQFLSYYCPNAKSGCITFRYRYAGDGSREFEPLQ
jgi:hypothetical protein